MANKNNHLVMEQFGELHESEKLEAALPVLENKLKVEKKYFVNKIVYPDLRSVMNYWKSTTFFNSDFEKEVEADLLKHFEINPSFILEKHVMAIIANKDY